MEHSDQCQLTGLLRHTKGGKKPYFLSHMRVCPLYLSLTRGKSAQRHARMPPLSFNE